MAERKKYIDVHVPLLNSSIRVLGTLTDLDNRTIKLDMTRRMRGKGLTITFRIFKKDKELVAVPNKLELVKSYIRRMMRKRTDYVEDSFSAACADVKATIKPFLITRKRVSRAVRKNLRNTAREFLTDYVEDREYNDLCEEIRMGSLQKALLPKLKKVYPLSFCDLRVFETRELAKVDIEKILEGARAQEVEVEAEDTDAELEGSSEASKEDSKGEDVPEGAEEASEEDSTETKAKEKPKKATKEKKTPAKKKVVKKAAKKVKKTSKKKDD